MAILQAGFPKSGNSWLYRILQATARHGNLERRCFICKQPTYELAKARILSFDGQAEVDVLNIEPDGCFYRVTATLREPIEDIDDYVSQCSHVWTHRPFCERSLTVLPKFDKVVYIIRDPRDVADSLSRFAFTPFFVNNRPPHGYADPEAYRAARLVPTVRSWVRHVGGYLRHKDDLSIHFVFYERLLHAFDTEFSDLLEYLGVDLDAHAVAAIKNEVGFATMKQKSPDHLQKGQSGGWVQVLSDEQKKQAARIAGPMLKLLNYPVNQIDSSLPRLPARLSSSRIEKAVTASQRVSFLRYAKRVVRSMVKRQTVYPYNELL